MRDGRLYYRGQDAVRLSRTATLEEVARLLRGGLGLPPDEGQTAPAGPTARSRAFAAFALRADADRPAQGQAPEDPRQRGRAAARPDGGRGRRTRGATSSVRRRPARSTNGFAGHGARRATGGTRSAAP
ncbi:MAG: hypothetical protein WDM85_05300 [Caulobacteraceae bacterium]